MDHMWYPFIIMVKSSQEIQGEEVTAGLCYMIICFPSVFMLLIPTVAARFIFICFSYVFMSLIPRLQKDWGKIGESTVVSTK